MSASPSIDAADPADLPAIRALLRDAGLPVDDLTGGDPVRFWLIRDASGPIGTIALERYEDVALLRSLAVRSDHRGEGLARALVLHAERQATAEGIRSLYLLTTTASDLFARLGYERIARTQAPEAAQRTAQFRSLCPDSAVCRVKHLGT